jgi:hypothetical protein
LFLKDVEITQDDRVTGFGRLVRLVLRSAGELLGVVGDEVRDAIDLLNTARIISLRGAVIDVDGDEAEVGPACTETRDMR